MADLVVDRGADGAGEGRVARRGVAHRGGLHLEFVGQVFQAEPVQLAGGDARLDVGVMKSRTLAASWQAARILFRSSGLVMVPMEVTEALLLECLLERIVEL